MWGETADGPGVSYDSTYDSEALCHPSEDVENAKLLSDDSEETGSQESSHNCDPTYKIFSSSLKADSSLSRVCGYFDSCFCQTWHMVPVKTFLAVLISTVATSLMYYSVDSIHGDLVAVMEILATQANSETPASLDSNFVLVKLAFSFLPSVAALLAIPGAIITHVKLYETVKRDKTTWAGKWCWGWCSATVHCRNANVGSTAFSVLMLILMFALFIVFIMLAGAVLGISYGIKESNAIGFQYLSAGQEGIFNLALAVENVANKFNSTLHSVFARLSDTESELNATFTTAMSTMGLEMLGTNKTNDTAAYLVSMMSLHAANFLANSTSGAAHIHSTYEGRPFQHSAKVLTQVMSTCEQIEPRDVLQEFSEDDDFADFSKLDTSTSSSQVPYLEGADGSIFEYVNGSLFSLPNASLNPNTSFLVGVLNSIPLVSAVANTSFGNVSLNKTFPELVSNHSTIFFSDGSRVQVPNGAAVKLPNRTILPPLMGSVIHLPAGGSYMLPDGTQYKVVGSLPYLLLRGEETPTSEGREVTKLSDMKPSGLTRQMDEFAEGGVLPHALLDSAMGNVLGVSLFTSLLDAVGIPLSLFQQLGSSVTHVKDKTMQVKDVVGDVMRNKEELMGDVKDQMGDVKDQMEDVKDHIEDVKNQTKDVMKNMGGRTQNQTQDVMSGMQNKVRDTQNQLQSAVAQAQGSKSKMQEEELSDFLDSWQYSRLHSLLCQSDEVVSMLRKVLPMLDRVWSSEFQKSLDRYKLHKLAAQTEQPGVCNTDRCLDFSYYSWAWEALDDVCVCDDELDDINSYMGSVTMKSIYMVVSVFVQFAALIFLIACNASNNSFLNWRIMMERGDTLPRGLVIFAKAKSKQIEEKIV